MDADYKRRVERSRQMTPEERFYGTLEMIDLSRELMRAGIRMQVPGADEDDVRRIMRERIRTAQAIESRS
jgi:hypothetical protein